MIIKTEYEKMCDLSLIRLSYSKYLIVNMDDTNGIYSFDGSDAFILKDDLYKSCIVGYKKFMKEMKNIGFHSCFLEYKEDDPHSIKFNWTIFELSLCRDKDKIQPPSSDFYTVLHQV